MSTDASPYSTLGLSPGADWDAIERAYKKLIKRYHPDRAGGDASRAAEITRAYRELRRARDDDDSASMSIGEWRLESPPSRNRWIWVAMSAAIAVGLLVLATGPVAALVRSLAAIGADRDHQHSASAQRGREAMDQPLSIGAIDASIHDALSIARTKDEVALATKSSDCHRQLRLKPSLVQLDRCAAFDDAVVQLQDRDPLRDQGPFSELSVTSRQMNAASSLSDDSLAIDTRLDRIRLHVELAVAPRVDLPPPPPRPAESNSDDNSAADYNMD
jgi:hypothetical protein